VRGLGWTRASISAESTDSANGNGFVDPGRPAQPCVAAEGLVDREAASAAAKTARSVVKIPALIVTTVGGVEDIFVLNDAEPKP
jgi:hypothetical protein